MVFLEVITMHPRTVLLLLSVSAAVATGCSGSPRSATEPVDLTQASLRRAQSCGDLTAMLQADARSKMNRRVDAEIHAVREGWSYGYGGAYDMASTAGGTFNGALGAPSAALPAATGTTSGAGAAGAAPATPPAHSNTETQVKGVDEADIVKTDGTYIYLLHGDRFLIVDSWPATSLATAASVAIEGEPLEMFVASGQAVVFSRVDGTAVYAAAHVPPLPEYSDVYSPGYFGGGGGVAMVGGPAGGTAFLPVAGGVAAPGGASGASGPVYPDYSTAPLAKVTVLSITGTQASVTRELYFEGSYLSSRRIDSRVRVILTGGAHGPALVYTPTFPSTVTDGGATTYVAPTEDEQVAAWEALRRTNEDLIARTTYADWVPYAFAKTGGQITASSAPCADFYLPTAGTTDFGMTQIESLDLAAPGAPPTVAAIVGSVSTVYANDRSLVLAAEAYVDPWLERESYAGSAGPVTLSNGTQQPAPVVPVETLNHTHLHLFDIATDPSTPQYSGSGTVPGDVLNQFSLDESSGSVRVTTTEQRSGPTLADGKQNQVSHVFVLTNDRGRLSITGNAGEIAPGEQLYATRYVGDKCYVVTWNVTDPLFVVDVADPKSPRVLGQVQIPGFSTYIHPLDATHLLTIGRETDLTGHQHAGSYWFGIAIQVFDVTDPLNPKLQYKYVYDGGEYATTEAMDNHKAFTYFDDKKLLAFPYVHQGSFGASGPSSTLEVFQVGVAEGINKLGSVSHSALLGTLPDGNYGYCGGYFDGSVRRGVFIGSFVYSISYGGIIASDVAALGTPVSTLKLDAPTMAGVCQ